MAIGLEKYDIKILLALLESIKGRKDFFRWLLDNGYPELAAFSNAIRGDIDAMKWLFKYKYEWLAILSNAIDGEEKARMWIAKAAAEVNIRFALACRKDEKAIEWLAKRDLKIFLMMAEEIYIVLDTQALENLSWYTMKFGQQNKENKETIILYIQYKKISSDCLCIKQFYGKQKKQHPP